MNGTWTRRDFLCRAAAAGTVVVAGPSLLSACAGGGFKVGIANEAPYGFTDPSGKVTGESVEVARAVLAAMGTKDIQAETVDFNALIPGLISRRYEVVTAGMFIRPDRCAAAQFTDPDYTAPTALLVPKGNPKGLKDYQDVKASGARLAVLSGAVEKQDAQNSGVPPAQLQSFDTQNTLLQAVSAGRADAGALTSFSLQDVVKKNPGASVEVTPGFFPVINGKPQISAGAFVFRKGDDRVNAFNAELRRIHQNGDWLRIVEPFGFTAENIPKPDVTTAGLCAG
jgi:polar amino acid transport system substrate-binding protein